MQPLIGTPDLLPETGVLAIHNSDFSVLKQTHRPGYGYGGRTMTLKKRSFTT